MNCIKCHIYSVSNKRVTNTRTLECLHSRVCFYALKEERHGYGIMQYVDEITRGRILLGAGTIYQSISKLEKEELIRQTKEENRQKKYIITENGMIILKEESKRVEELYNIAKEML